MIVCEICKKDLNDLQGLSHHLTSKHHMNKQQYYDTYLKIENEGFCRVCHKPTDFSGFSIGYAKYCNNSCRHLDKDVQMKYKKTMLERYGFEHYFQDSGTQEKARLGKKLSSKTAVSVFTRPDIIQKIANTRQEKLSMFEQEHDCTQYKKITEKYGSTVWYKLRLPKLKLGRDCFVENKYLPKIDEYMKVYSEQVFHVSNAEKQLVTFIKSFYHGTVITNSRSIIKPLELDIYLPELNLAIEYNGTWFHSSNSGTPKEYHLVKSRKCRDLSIRLIHIYEFEDFNTQLGLLRDLINGVDNYPANDYNKNNLIDGFDDVKPTLVPNKSYDIYTVGQLLI